MQSAAATAAARGAFKELDASRLSLSQAANKESTALA